MKFTPEVVAALTVLRNAAENDFERRRLDVLERDLTTPPKVEIIDETHQKFNGFIYTKTSSGHYERSTNIHRDIWFYCVNEIPNNYHIHHIDHNPANNQIENLQSIEKGAHQRLHKAMPIKKRICPICKKSFVVRSVRPKQIYCSHTCAAKGNHQSKRVEITCAHCGKKIFVRPSLRNTKYCSRHCFHEAHKAHKQEKLCPVCKNLFTTTESKQIYCSRHCANKVKQNIKKRPFVEKICTYCKKNFAVQAYRANQKYCSKQCYFESKRSKK